MTVLVHSYAGAESGIVFSQIVSEGPALENVLPRYPKDLTSLKRALRSITDSSGRSV